MGQLGCSSTSRFKQKQQLIEDGKEALPDRIVIDQPMFQYEIFSSSTTYGCDGRELTDYTPNIGVDSSTGRLVSFEKLTRRNFCDATFMVMIHQDDLSILGS